MLNLFFFVTVASFLALNHAASPPNIFKKAPPNSLVLLSIVTNLPFANKSNKDNLEKIYTALKPLARENYVEMPLGQKLDKVAMNSGGKLLVKLLYKDFSANCGGVKSVAKVAKTRISYVTSAIVNCEGTRTII
ncbi:unnamed protein product [Caenorhabditis auriculariae]|uniref:Uncharacterized protein n=1 Tax=Caenorhabditis auriculariae TaxID=2777116 RepID=A0A8S1GUM7_9PELO|nr:unnamed protein product [Caenorhabditis auriculariae]